MCRNMGKVLFLDEDKMKVPLLTGSLTNDGFISASDSFLHHSSCGETHSLTQLLICSLAHALAHSLTPSLARLLTHLLTHPLTHPLTHTCTPTHIQTFMHLHTYSVEQLLAGASACV